MSAKQPRGLTPEESAQFAEHGFVILRGVLEPDDFAPMQADLEALVAAKADDWLERGLVTSSHADAPFERRLALLAAELQPSSDDELAAFGLSLDTMHARTQGTFSFFFTPRLLSAIESVVGGEIDMSPIQHLRPFLPAQARDGSSERRQIAAGAAAMARTCRRLELAFSPGPPCVSLLLRPRCGARD
jgi:hypothetical protein